MRIMSILASNWSDILLVVTTLVLSSLLGRLVVSLASHRVVGFLSPSSICAGVFGWTTFVSVPGILLPASYSVGAALLLPTGTVIFFVFALITRQSRKRHSQDPQNSLTLAHLACLLICLTIYILGDAVRLRSHISPDIQGFAAVVSYLRDDIGLSGLKSDFMRETGETIPVMRGQPTDLLASVWNIPDARLRWASDQVLTAGRYGFPVAMSSLWVWNQRDGSFEFLMIWLALVGVTLAASLAVQSAMNLLNLVKKTANTSLGAALTTSFLVLILTASPGVTVMIVEGQTPQIWVVVAVVYQFFMHTERAQAQISATPLNIRGVAQLSLPSLFLAASYPQGLLPLFVVVTIGITLEIFAVPRGTNRLQILRYGLLGTALPAIAMFLAIAPRNFLNLTSAFLKGESGGAYGFGFISFHDGLLGATQSLKFLPVPLGGFSADWTYQESIVSILGLIALTILTVLKISRGQLSQSRVLWLAPLLMIIFSIQPLRYLIMEFQGTPYFYLRGQQFQLFVALIPIALLIEGIIRNRKQLRILVWFGLLLLTVSQLSCLQQSLTQFDASSREFSIVKKTDVEGINRPYLLFTKEPLHDTFSMALWGPLYYMTDNWNPRLIPQNNQIVFECIYLEEHPRHLIRIGTLKVTSTIDGPVRIKDLTTLPGFTPNENYMLAKELSQQP